jgi:hypothetical protein
MSENIDHAFLHPTVLFKKKDCRLTLLSPLVSSVAPFFDRVFVFTTMVSASFVMAPLIPTLLRYVIVDVAKFAVVAK